MKKDNERNYDEVSGRSDPLTRMLRDADPVEGDPGLPAAELARLRQQVTETARSHRPWYRPLIVGPLWTRPALSMATTAIVVAGLWLLFGPLPAAPPDPVATASHSTPSPSEPMVPEPATRELVIADAIPDPRHSTGFTTLQPAPKLPAPTVPELDDVGATMTGDLPSPDVRPRTVRFTAPRRTRIIWTLDPDFESPVPGPGARQEQGK